MSAADGTGPLTADDLDALAAIARGNEWLRAVLCTLARRGVAVRHEEPDRCNALIDALAPWPWFKAGQFLFDLMEWEDFMLDGAPPPVVPTVLDASALSRIERLLGRVKGLVDGAADAPRNIVDSLDVHELATEDTELPELEPGFYLYRDVVLGAIVSVGPRLEAQRQPPSDGDDWDLP